MNDFVDLEMLKGLRHKHAPFTPPDLTTENIVKIAGDPSKGVTGASTFQQASDMLLADISKASSLSMRETMAKIEREESAKAALLDVPVMDAPLPDVSAPDVSVPSCAAVPKCSAQDANIAAVADASVIQREADLARAIELLEFFVNCREITWSYSREETRNARAEAIELLAQLKSAAPVLAATPAPIIMEQTAIMDEIIAAARFAVEDSWNGKPGLRNALARLDQLSNVSAE